MRPSPRQILCFTALAVAVACGSSPPVALQVLGYGFATSYQYPGGLNLQLVAPPPPPLQ
jgi:hypothetical protein